jgi:hypothetical protein
VNKNKEYNITGTLTIDIDFDIEEYENKEEALQKAKEMLEDYFRLKSSGSPYFSPLDVKLELEAEEIEYDEE